MKTRPMTIQVPEPDDDGLCSIRCDLLQINEGLCSARCNLLQINDDIYFKCKYGMVFEECLCKPGPGCPWHSEGGGKMSEVKRFFTALGFDPEPYVEMIEDTDGTYVYYEDYETLRAQLAEAQKEAFPAYKREKALRCKAEFELAEARKENEELKTHAYAEAENAKLRAMIKEWMPVMEGYAESTHFVEGFRRKANKWDDRLIKIKEEVEDK